MGRNYREILVIPYFRNAVRDVVSGYPVKNIYTESGRQGDRRQDPGFLEENLEPRGIQVVDVLLRDVKLPQRFRESIEAKLTAEQQVQQKQFMLEQAKKDAEIEVARAKGAAQAQEIVRSTLSDSLSPVPVDQDAQREPERHLRRHRGEPADLPHAGRYGLEIGASVLSRAALPVRLGALSRRSDRRRYDIVRPGRMRSEQV